MHVLGTAGHVDHGKSTLVRALTGIDPDRLAEERERGLTIDLGFAWLTLPSGREVGIVDVPGHERFISNMLAGAGGITVCLFVVSASEGWMPQSTEHLAILDLLGIEHGVVALTKADLVDKARLAEMETAVRQRLEPSGLRDAPIVAVSGVDDTGRVELLATLDEMLVEAPVPAIQGSQRMWVDRAFVVTGSGTVVTGTVARGCLQTGDAVEILPGKESARIRALQTHNKKVDSIPAGNRAAINLVGVADSQLRGRAVVGAGWRCSSVVDVMLRVPPRELGGVGIETRGAHLLYVGSASTAVRVKPLDGQRVEPGSSAPATLYLADELPLLTGDRMVIRDSGPGITAAGATVLDPAPPTSRRHDDARIETLLQLADCTEVARRLAVLVGAEHDLEISDARWRAGAVGDEEVSLPANVKVLGDRYVSVVRFAELEELVTTTLANHHAEHPGERGQQREALRSIAGLGKPAFDALIDAMGLAGTNTLALPTHSAALPPELRAQADALVSRLRSAGFEPPLSTELRVSSDLLRALVDAGEIVQIGNFYLTSGMARRAREVVREEIERAGPVTVSRIRDLLGTTRKYAVPLSEWLDSTGATIRRGDLRHLGPKP
jgi:selenocysteine-specific elongation factor